MPRHKSLDRDRAAPYNRRVYHPYVNDPSFCQRLFEISCFVLILASVPAWLGGVYSIFISGYGTALGLIGLLSFGTRRHSLLFLVLSIIFFIFVIVVIILNAIDPVGKNLPFYDETNFSQVTGSGVAAAVASSFAKRQTTDNGTCQYSNCTFNLYNVGQLSDGQLRLRFGSGAGPVSFALNEGVLLDNSGRKCYLSAQSQLQCDLIPQTDNYNRFCIDNGRLTYAASPLWYSCYTGTGNQAANIYSNQLYGHCSPFMNLTVVNSTCGAGSEGVPSDVGSGGNLIGGGGVGGVGNGNGTNGTDTGAGAAFATGVFVGSRVYAYIDSGIILAATLLTILAALAIIKEVRPAPGTLTHSSTTSTSSAPFAPVGGAPVGAPGYAVPAAAATAAAVPAAFAARGPANYGGAQPFSHPVAVNNLSPAPTTVVPALAVPAAAATAVAVPTSFATHGSPTTLYNGGVQPFSHPVAVNSLSPAATAVAPALATGIAAPAAVASVSTTTRGVPTTTNYGAQAFSQPVAMSNLSPAPTTVVPAVVVPAAVATVPAVTTRLAETYYSPSTPLSGMYTTASSYTPMFGKPGMEGEEMHQL